jgi:hypothetical protein
MADKAKPKKVTLFVQDRSGNHNLELEYSMRDLALSELNSIHERGGYWTRDGDDSISIFVPWHRVDFARINEE